MGIPRQTRVLLITDEQGSPRELRLSRRLVVALLVTGFCGLVLVVVLLFGYGQAVVQARRASEMVARLEKAETEAKGAAALRQELDHLRTLQERLLAMLGVDQDDVASDSTVAPRIARTQLQDRAGDVVTPRPSIWPVVGYVTREFVNQTDHGGDHPGIDIAQPAQSPVQAPGDGTVARVGTDPFLGNFLEIQHGLGYLTVYGHCSRVVVRAGVPVRRGQIIAYTGQTGEAAAPHLHFEIWRDGRAIDPREVLRGDPSPA